ncbi:hypothetical protein MMC09_006457 [Bachmanniomyces sp. S44760]|nr:hypothetical protein [Bachmanniomyces sp. S44760]
MADPPGSQNASAISIRSRASSIMSTGTKTSIGTLVAPSEDDPNRNIEVLLGRRNFRISARPGSILSVRSFDQPAPPYENYALDSTLLQAAHHDHGFDTPEASSWPSTDSISTLAIAPNDSPSTLAPSITNAHPLLQTSSHEAYLATSSPTTAIDSENALSQHYTAVVRTIDENHRAEVARLESTHRLALSDIRHSIDAAYRRELKARDSEVEKIKEECAALIASVEDRHIEYVQEKEREVEKFQGETAARLIEEHLVAVEKARHEVEDVWEGRWKQRNRIVDEEAAARELRGKETLAKRLDARDGEWAERLSLKWPHMLEAFDEMRTEMSCHTATKEKP